MPIDPYIVLGSAVIGLLVGIVPAVIGGSLLSSSVPDRYIRPAIAFVIFASGLKYVGVGTTALGWTLCAAGSPARQGGSRTLVHGNGSRRPPLIDPRPQRGGCANGD